MWRGDEIEKGIATGPWKKRVAKDYNVGMSYDGVTYKMIVETDAPSSVTPALADAYDDKIKVRRARITQQYNRFSDYSPFFGGSPLVGPGRNNQDVLCSSGFALANVEHVDTRQRVEMMTTAGHCSHVNSWSTMTIPGARPVPGHPRARRLPAG